MDWIIKLAAAAVLSALLAVMIQKTTPANALLVSIAAAVMIALASATFLQPVLSFVRKLEVDFSVSSVYTGTMIKCVLISVVTRFGISICKDAGQSGLASALDFGGTIASVWVAIPLFESLMAMLEELI